MRYGGASDAGPYVDPGKDHWRKVVVCILPLLTLSGFRVKE